VRPHPQHFPPPHNGVRERVEVKATGRTQSAAVVQDADQAR
jgi:hypothetical protein